jgi:hypothetical protein
MVLRIFAILITLGISLPKSWGQDPDSRFFLEAGLVARTTLLYTHSADKLPYGSGINTNAPYSFRRGIHGGGLNVLTGFRISPEVGLSLDLSSTARYDSYYTYGGEPYTWYIDLSVSLKKCVSKRFYIGAGYTVFNMGKEIRYQILPGPDWPEIALPLQFSSIDVMLGAKLWRLYVEPKVSLVTDNFPGNLKDDATLIHLRVYYRFDFGVQGKQYK